MKTNSLESFGYKNCIAFENAVTRVGLCPQVGGHVLDYSPDGVNALDLDPSQQGWWHMPGIPTVVPCGGRCDIGPGNVTAPHPDLWFEDSTGEIVGKGKARLTSARDPMTGVQRVREFTLAADSARLVCEQRIANVSEKPVTSPAQRYAPAGAPKSKFLRRFT
jgi:hypothetical protein